MRSSKPARRALVTAVSLTAFAVTCAAAQATPTTSTISGGGVNGSPFSPDSVTFAVEVEASLTRKMAAGTLRTASHHTGGPVEETVFEGAVTCMKVMRKGEKVVVGAYGTATEEPGKVKDHRLPGKYAQVLTVEFGSFGDPEDHEVELNASVGVLGESAYGVPAGEAPNCRKASFKHQFLLTGSEDLEFTKTK